MELKLQKLNYMTSTFAGGKSANKIFNVTVKDESNVELQLTFIADIEPTAEFDPVNSRYNKNDLLSVSSNETKQLIHQLYPTSTCFYKSAVYRVGKAGRMQNTYDFLNITNHKLETPNVLSNFIQVDNVVYGLEAPSKYGRYDLDIDIYSWISSNNGLNYPIPAKISTAIYDLSAIKDALAKDDLEALQKNAISINLDYIHYNMLYEIPGTAYNDFESGNIAANTYKCKNCFNNTYDMKHDDDYILRDTRQYNDILHNNKLVYATYRDNIAYKYDATKTTTTNKYNCDHVEVINAMNRFAKLTGHKTNAYSIQIYSDLFTLLGKDGNTLKIAGNLRTEIKHAVVDIVKKLAPVSTLLIGVNITDLES